MKALSGQPFGRYHLRDADASAPSFDVHLLGIPTDLYIRTRQQQSELVREFVLLGLGYADRDPSQPAEVRQLILELGVTFVRGKSRADEQIEAAERAGAPSLDLHYRVPSTVVDGADRLGKMMARADDICGRGLMLTMPRTPPMLALSRWWLNEFRGQIEGRSPIPWPLSDEAADLNQPLTY